MIIQASDFKDACSMLRRVPVSASIKSSQFFRAEVTSEGLTLRAQCDVLARYTVPCTGSLDAKSFHIERASFLPFVDSLRLAEVEIETVKSKLVMKQARRRIAFSDVEAGKYAKFDLPAERVKLTEYRVRLLRAARAYALDDAGEPRFNCVMMDGKTLMGASHVAFFVAETDGLPRRVPVSLFICDSIKDGAKLYTSESATALATSAGALYHPLSSSCVKEFPAQAMLERAREAAKSTLAFEVPAGRFLDAVKALQSIASGSVTDDMVLSVKVQPGKLVCSVSGQAVQVTETVKAETHVEDKVEMLLVSIAPFLTFAAAEKHDGTVKVRYTPKSGYHFAFEDAVLLAARRDPKAK